MTPYEAGYDCGINGANDRNCHFRFFTTPEQTREWERGKADAEMRRAILGVKPVEPRSGQ